jgi:hypothetical protein
MPDFFQLLGQLVVSQCPGSYAAAELVAQVDDGWSRIGVTCKTLDGREFKPEVPPVDTGMMHELIEDIREDMAKTGPEKFSSCTFTVDREGKLDFKVGYGPVD